MVNRATRRRLLKDIPINQATVSLRLQPHPSFKRPFSEVLAFTAVGKTDSDLALSVIEMMLGRMGYTSASVQAAVLGDVINHWPQELRRLAAAIIVRGLGFKVEVEFDDAGQESVSPALVEQYEPLVDTKKAETGSSELWTPGKPL